MKIDFERHHTIWGKYSDALYLPDDHSYTDEQIESLKDERFNSWVSIIEAPQTVENEPTLVESPVVEPAKEYIELNGVKYVRVEG